MVKLADGQFGEIQHFFIDNLHRVMTSITPLTGLDPLYSCDTLNKYIVPVSKENRVIFRSVTDIFKKCVLVELKDNNEMYVCIIPNFIESD